MIKTPYLLFLGDAPDQLAAKVAQGIKDWRPENAVAQFRMAGCNADLGLADMTLEQAKAAGAKTLVIGVANRGGGLSAAWKEVLLAALEAGFDIASGLHNLLRDEPDLVAVANAQGLARMAIVHDEPREGDHLGAELGVCSDTQQVLREREQRISHQMLGG